MVECQMIDPKQKFKDELIATARQIVRPGFGILAADESTGTIGKRFEVIKLENIEENRRTYRELLFTAPELDKYISGVILYDETVRQSGKDGRSFPDLLKSRGIIAGIKVDKGVVNLAGTCGETATQGLDGLAGRCEEYYKLGCRFAKWRAVLKIGQGLPSKLSVMETAHTLARYAAICQDNGLVPIVEPEILADGDHDIKVCAEASERTFSACVQALIDHHVLLEGCLLKPNMVTPGNSCPTKATPPEIASFTVRTLSRTIPPAIPGIVFLSGGQSEEMAALNLSAMNKFEAIKKPWALTFSYGRALQGTTIKKWDGKAENLVAAQAQLGKQGNACSQGSMGKYEGGEGSTESLIVKNYVY